MWLFNWWGKRQIIAHEQLQPEADWIVTLTGGYVTITESNGLPVGIAIADLTGIAVATNDTGPWGADVWWHLFGCDSVLVGSFPQGATGEQAIIDELIRLPGFDNQALGNAMRSTTNAIFPVWRRET